MPHLFRISRPLRLLVGIILISLLARHFRSFSQVNQTLETLDVFQRDLLGRAEHWKVPEKREDVPLKLRKTKEKQHSSSLPVDEKHKFASNSDTKTVDSNNLQALQNRFYQDHYQSLYNTTSSLDNLLVWSSQEPAEAGNNNGDELFFWNVWKHFDYYHSPDKEERVPLDRKHFLRIDDSLCRVALSFNQQLKDNNAKFIPHVILFHLNETMGGFSSPMNNDTGLPDGRYLSYQWNDEGCAEAMVFAYLSHPSLRAVFTTQYQVYDEKKIHSLPLGVRSQEYGKKILHRIQMLRGHAKRTQLLMMNSPVTHDFEDIPRLLSDFKEAGHRIQNTYGTNAQNYLDKLTTSKFFLSPGFEDSHQIWEALLSGCIPVLQHFGRKDGWFRTLDQLPVAWIDSFDNLTPRWLEQEYRKLIEERQRYKWDKLTQQWWVDYIHSFLPKEIQAKALSRNNAKEQSTGRIVGLGDAPSLVKEPSEEQNPSAPKHSTEQDLETIFYERHYQSLHNISTEDMLVWQAENAIYGTPFSRFWEHFDYYQPDPGLSVFPFNVSNYLRIDYNICQVALAFNEDLKLPTSTSLPHVLLYHLDVDKGGFSSPIDTEDGLTIQRDLLDGWNELGCSEGQIFQYLSHPKMRATITTQYQIYDERKIHSIPLGIKTDENGVKILSRLQKHALQLPRPKLVTMHTDPETVPIANVMERFQQSGVSIENSFTGQNQDKYFDNLAQSKFVLSSKGKVFDTYQHWEALLSGCIPVIEHFNHTMRNGWMRVFDGLPVAWIDSYESLTPQWLESEYAKVLEKARTYKWEKLSRNWWIQFVKSFVNKKRG